MKEIVVPVDVPWELPTEGANIQLQAQEERNLLIQFYVCPLAQESKLGGATNDLRKVQLTFSLYSSVMIIKDGEDYGVLKQFDYFIEEDTKGMSMTDIVKSYPQLLFSYVDDCPTLTKIDRRNKLKRYLFCAQEYHVEIVGGEFTVEWL